MGIVLITGASRGIGLEFARQCAERGDEVIATCRRPHGAEALSRLAQRYANLSIEELDLSSDADIESIARKLEKADTELDWVLSNAGVLLNEDFGKWTRLRFADTLNVNVTGAALLAQALIPCLSATGKLVHLSSRLGSLESGGEGMTAADSYSISKAALNMLTVRLASALKGTSRCVVSMSPGWVATDMGGSDAALAVEESVSKMLRTIGALTAEDSGRFMDNQGNPIPW